MAVKPCLGAPFSHLRGHHVAVLPADRRPPVARRSWDAAPDGPAPGPRARPPKRSRRARSARSHRRSGGACLEPGGRAPKCTTLGTRFGRNPSESSHASVYTPRGANWRPKPFDGATSTRGCPWGGPVPSESVRSRSRERVVLRVASKPCRCSPTFVGFLTSKNAPRSILLGRSPEIGRAHV